MIRLVCTEGGSNKFWEGAVEGAAVTTRWGKVGSDGQTKTKTFGETDEAEKELAKLIREKRAKGYTDGVEPPAAAATKKAPAAAPESKAGPGFRNVRGALDAVRAGDAMSAHAALLAFEEKGAGEASAALAMIAAYGKRWDDAVAHAARAFASPGAIYAGNVWSDLQVLLLRAARETGSFDAVLSAVPAQSPWENGTALYGRIRKTLTASKTGKAERPAADPPNPKAFAMAVSELAADKKLAKKSESERARRRFFVAVNCGMWDEAMAVFAERPSALHYEHVVAIAPTLVQRGEGDRAWAALHERLWSWVEVDRAQIAPADLLGDALWPIATTERLASVLATPRGIATWSAAYKSGKADL
jgi:predicted DNA-binding WGR domain protein